MATIRDRVKALLDEIAAGGAVDRDTAIRWAYEIQSLVMQHYGDNSTHLQNARTATAYLARGAGRGSGMPRLMGILRALEKDLEAIPPGDAAPGPGRKIFIGHGGSPVWRDLKDFIQERLHLEWDEFNREATAGLTTAERLSQMLDDARFAFLVMTAEDEHADATRHARENVIHEIGLFQGRLGFRCAIILLEEGCAEFSNIHGVQQIRFPNGNITAKFEEIRRVLEREGIISPVSAGRSRTPAPPAS